MDAETIRRITIEARTQGVDQATRSLQGLAQAQESNSKSTLSVGRSYEGLQRRLDVTHRAQKEFERDVQTLTRAQAQGLIPNQARLNELMGLATQRYQQATGSLSPFNQVMAQAQTHAAGMAGRVGALGTALTGLGPVGLAAGAALGGLALGGAKAVQMANDLAERSGAMVDFAETTGLSTTALQALTKAGAQVGINSDKIGSGFERFSVQLEELRDGSGALYKALEQINPALVDQIALAKDAAGAWDVLAQAYVSADQGQRNVLARAAFGRTGIGMGRLLSASNEAGGITGLQGNLSRYAPSQEDLKRWDDLGDKIAEIKREATTTFTAMFADEVLSKQLLFYQGLLKIVELMREMKDTDVSKGFSELANIAQVLPGLLRDSLNGRKPGPPDLADQLGAKDIAGAGNDPGKGLRDIEIARMREIAGVLGEAITPAEQFDLKMKELASSVEKFGISSEVAARAANRIKSEFNYADNFTALKDQLEIAKAVTGQEKLAAQERATYNRVLAETGNHERAAAEASLQRQVSQAQINSQAEQTLQSMRDQFAVASAVTGADRIRAQARATYNQLVRQGVSDEKAGAIASQQQANAFAQVNAQARERLLTLKDQEAVAGAVTGWDRIQAQAAATYNQLRREGVTHANAMAVAEQQVANGVAAATAAVVQQTISLQEQTALIEARRVGAEAAVAAEIAYNRAIRDGAQEWAARDLARATEANVDARNRKPAVQPSAELYPGLNALSQQGYVQGELTLLGAGNLTQTTKGLEYSFDRMLQLGGNYGSALDRLFQGNIGSVGGLMGRFDFNQAIPLVERVVDLLPESQQASQIERILGEVGKQAQTVERDELIARLNDKLDDLRKATDENTDATLGLSEIYSAGHSALRIGFYDEGERSVLYDPSKPQALPSSATYPGVPVHAATGFEGVVGGSGGTDSQMFNLFATPGEHISIRTPSQQRTIDALLRNAAATARSQPTQQTVVQNFNFNVKGESGLGDRRTRRQITEGFGNNFATLGG